MAPQKDEVKHLGEKNRLKQLFAIGSWELNRYGVTKKE